MSWMSYDDDGDDVIWGLLKVYHCNIMEVVKNFEYGEVFGPIKFFFVRVMGLIQGIRSMNRNRCGQ